MVLRHKVHHLIHGDFNHSLVQMHLRFYSSKVNWAQLRPVIFKKINNRPKGYPVKNMVPVAHHVLKARVLLAEGVSTLLKAFPVKSCGLCTEIFIGSTGHQIKSCRSSKGISMYQEHQWEDGNLNDILVPVEVFHLKDMCQDVIEHDQRFDFHRVPAVVELCYQAVAKANENCLYDHHLATDHRPDGTVKSNPSLPQEPSSVAQRTIEAWEALRLGVQQLMEVCPVNVCKNCREVHVGVRGHKVRLCQVLKYKNLRGSHDWKKAQVDDLVPPKVLWHRRPQDPPVLVNSGRDCYGRAPAVVELCSQAGARVPPKYASMMKPLGLSRS